jgi:hypothetical protein
VLLMLTLLVTFLLPGDYAGLYFGVTLCVSYLRIGRAGISVG